MSSVVGLVPCRAAKGQEFGSDVSAAGDLNGDGKCDIVAGASGAGLVAALSGADGVVLWERQCAPADEKLGWVVAGVGDTSGDGVPDVLAGAPGAKLGKLPNVGKVLLLSGRDGSILREVMGSTAGESFGFALSAAGDLDGDKLPDFAIGAPGFSSKKLQRCGRVTILSSASGEVLAEILGAGPHDGFGWAIAGGEDVTADGVPDVVATAVPSSEDESAGQGSAYVLVVSGKARKMARRIGGNVEDGFGWSVALIPDIDGDKCAEVCVGSPWRGAVRPGESKTRRVGDPLRYTPTGLLEVFSGKSAKPLSRLTGGPRPSSLGLDVGAVRIGAAGKPECLAISALHDEMIRIVPFDATGPRRIPIDSPSMRGVSRKVHVAGIPDLNGDGCDEVVLGIASVFPEAPGVVQVLSGRDGARVFEISWKGTAAGK